MESATAVDVAAARSAGRLVPRLFWCVSLIATCVAGFVGFVTIVSANGAPQEASGAALACTIAFLPYAFARALDEIIRD